MIDVSVIIPIYNSKETVIKAINSVLSQQNVILEIICIDDGSTDGTSEEIDNHFRDNERIVVYKQENFGAGLSRNIGIQKARGEFIAFLDADDYMIDENALSKMLEKCRKFGVGVCGAHLELEHDGIRRRSNVHERTKSLALRNELEYSNYQFDYDFTTFIYKKSILDEIYPCFPDLKYYEDPPFLVRAMNQAGKFVMVDVEYYCYVLNPGVRKLDAIQCVDLVKGIGIIVDYGIKYDLNELVNKSIKRLVYEYGDWIYHHIDKRPEIRNELDRIRKLISSSTPITNGIMKRLYHRDYKDNYSEYIQKKIGGANDYYIYGRGIIAHTFISYIESIHLGKQFRGFVVTNLETGISDEGTWDIKSYSNIANKGLLVIAVSGIYIAEILEVLKKYDIRDFEILDLTFVYNMNQLTENK